MGNPRYQCPECFRYYLATANGRLRQHNRGHGTPRCKGSGGTFDRAKIHPNDMCGSPASAPTTGA